MRWRSNVRAYIQELLKRSHQGIEEEAVSTFTSSLLTKIADNIQLNISQVHIRYEDDLSAPLPFAFGLVLSSLEAVSADENWARSFLSEPRQFVNKLVSFSKFSMYWDTNAKFLEFNTLEELVQQLEETLENPSLQQHAIVEPVSGSLKARLNKSPLPDAENPKLTGPPPLLDLIDVAFPNSSVDFQMPRFTFKLEEQQFQGFMKMLDSFDDWERAYPFRKLRPTVRVAGAARDWWQFAIAAVVQADRDRARRWNWEHIRQFKEDKALYVELYRKNRIGRSSPEEKSQLEALELRLEFEDISYFRSLADEHLTRDQAFLQKVREDAKVCLPSQFARQRPAGSV